MLSSSLLLPTTPRGSGAGSDKGALAIVLAGGYADDSDEGEAFWYTGEGGQEKGKQVILMSMSAPAMARMVWYPCSVQWRKFCQGGWNLHPWALLCSTLELAGRSAPQADVLAQQGCSHLSGHGTKWHHTLQWCSGLPWSQARAPSSPYLPSAFLACPPVVQVRDQTFTGGNLALKHSHETGTPVRVFRGSKVTGRLQYTYEGLYKVTDVRHEVRWGMGEGGGEV